MSMFTTTENKTTNADQTVIIFRYFLVLFLPSIRVVLGFLALPMSFRAVIFCNAVEHDRLAKGRASSRKSKLRHKIASRFNAEIS